MFKLDNTLLEELGLGSLPVDEKNKMLAHIYETLEMRVGIKLAEQMTNEQLDEFEAFIDSNDEAGALKWLETNFPNYKQVVAEELENLKNEIKRDAAQIVAMSQQAAAQSPPAVPQQQNQQTAGQPTPPQPHPQQPSAPQAPPANVTQFPQQQPMASPPTTDQNQQPPFQQAA